MTAQRLLPFGTSIFTEMTQLAQRHDAVNLAQGFPDFEGPPEILEAAHAAMRAGENQYARSLGHPRLVQAVAAKMRRCYGLEYDPLREVVVTCGATEGVASALLGLLDPGDEVILFEPFYDSYPVCVTLAGGVPRYCTLEFPDFRVTEAALRPLFNARTRAILVNTPHNPSGHVLARDELQAIARLCVEHDVVALCDEVYEHIVFDGARHVPLAGLPGMRERTLTLSSTGKTFSLTGWKIGWGVGPADLVAAVQAAHQYVTFAVATPLQCGMAEALERFQDDYFARFQAEYQERRDFLVGVLRDVGFRVTAPEGAYFLLAGFSGLFGGDDREFARHLVEAVGVAAIPPTVFYRQHPEAGRKLLRFAFCKRRSTLERAAERLRRFRP